MWRTEIRGRKNSYDGSTLPTKSSNHHASGYTNFQPRRGGGDAEVGFHGGGSKKSQA